jgi:hypothetical protein
MKNSNDTIGNRSRDFPVCSAVPHPLRHRVPPNKTCSICINVIMRSVRENYSGRSPEITITYSECESVALVIQHAKRMRHIILSYVACLALQYFCPRYFTDGKNVGKIHQKLCVLIFSTFVRRVQRHITINVHRSSCTNLVII